jgi:glucose/mannose transport system permease protein
MARFRSRHAAILIVLPALLVSVVFVYLFIAWTGYASMTSWNQVRPLHNLLPDFPFIGLDNYGALFATKRFWPNDILNTVVFTVFFVGISLGVGLLLAILLDQRIRGESFFRNIFLLPMALSFVVTGTIWAWIFNPSTGINQLLDPLGLDAVRGALLGFAPLQPLWSALDALGVNVMRPGLTTDPRSALGAIVIAAVWQMSGFVMAMFLAGLRGVSDELREAARVDGAREWQIYWKILIPELRPVMISVIVLLGYVSLKIFDLVFVMTRGGPGSSTDFPSILLFDSAFKGQLWARGAAIAVVMFLLSAVVVLPYLWAQLRAERPR